MTRRSNQRIWVVIPIALMAFLSPAAGRTIYVDYDGSADFDTIQAAIDDSNDGDTIIVADGTYTDDGNRDIDFLGKAITLRSENGPENCIIDCNATNTNPHRGFYFHNGEDANSVLEGFTITNGYANDIIGQYGGAIHGNGTKATIQYNHIVGNMVFTRSMPTVALGGGLYDCDGSIQYNIISGNSAVAIDMESYSTGGGLSGCDGTIKDNVISNNIADFGGGMEFSSSNPIVSGCVFTENIANYNGGGMYSNDGSPTVTNCIFSGNVAMVGGGMYNGYDSNPMVINCTFSCNLADSQGGGIMNIAGPRPTVTNCILWGNMPDQIIDYDYPVSNTTVLFSDVQDGWPGLGNIDADPCFVLPGYWDPNGTPEDANDDFWIEGDYHLKSQAGRWDPNSESWVKDYVSSPCIDAGNPGCPEANEPAPNGNRRNMGAHGGTAEASKSPGNGRNIADLTNDWAVDSNDLKVLVDYWLQTGECIPGDFDRSEFVDSNDYSIFALQWSYKQDSVAIFIDSNTHSDLTTEIQRLKSDITNDLGVNVFIFSDNFDDIKQIKDIIIDKYNHAGLIGAIFIGDIPTAYFEYQNSGSIPTDRYFQDLSDKFIDVDGDGKFEREYYMWETDITMREIWTARIKPPVGRSEGVELLRDYLDRNHNYRTGNLTYEKKMLYYGSVSINQDGMSQDDYNDLVNQIDDYTGLYDSDDEVNSIYDPNLEMQKRIYLTELKNSYDFVFVNIHGTVWHQWLGENSPTDQCVVYYNEIKEFRPQSLFSVLASCSNGDFTTENYFAGWFLFSGSSLVVQANTTVSYLTGANTVQFLKDYIPLGLGVTFGDMDKNDRNFIVSHILGDPTLTLRPKPTGDLPSLSRYESEIDFGDVERGTIPRQYISFWNGGTATLKISYKKARISINGEYPNLGYWDVFYYEPSTTGEKFRDFEVRPGKCKVVPFYFYPRADGPIGRYTMTILFQTNDPENPYMEIHLSGNAI